jgi:hypothetical protein
VTLSLQFGQQLIEQHEFAAGPGCTITTTQQQQHGRYMIAALRANVGQQKRTHIFTSYSYAHRYKCAEEAHLHFTKTSTRSDIETTLAVSLLSTPAIRKG